MENKGSMDQIDSAILSDGYDAHFLVTSLSIIFLCVSPLGEVHSYNNSVGKHQCSHWHPREHGYH